MAWFFRAIELPDGSWACRHGLQEFDRHVDMSDAINHLSALAVDHGVAEIFVHRSDGTMERPWSE